MFEGGHMEKSHLCFAGKSRVHLAGNGNSLTVACPGNECSVETGGGFDGWSSPFLMIGCNC